MLNLTKVIIRTVDTEDSFYKEGENSQITLSQEIIGRFSTNSQTFNVSRPVSESDKGKRGMSGSPVFDENDNLIGTFAGTIIPFLPPVPQGDLLLTPSDIAKFLKEACNKQVE